MWTCARQVDWMIRLLSGREFKMKSYEYIVAFTIYIQVDIQPLRGLHSYIGSHDLILSFTEYLFHNESALVTWVALPWVSVSFWPLPQSNHHWGRVRPEYFQSILCSLSWRRQRWELVFTLCNCAWPTTGKGAAAGRWYLDFAIFH